MPSNEQWTQEKFKDTLKLAYKNAPDDVLQREMSRIERARSLGEDPFALISLSEKAQMVQDALKSRNP